MLLGTLVCEKRGESGAARPHLSCSQLLACSSGYAAVSALENWQSTRTEHHPPQVMLGLCPTQDDAGHLQARPADTLHNTKAIGCIQIARMPTLFI